MHQIDYVSDGRPPQTSGVYVAWINDDIITAYAARKLLYFDHETNRWSHLGSDQKYRGHVYGWCGPLPAMALVNSDEDVPASDRG